MTRAWSLIALLGLLVISAAQAQEPAQTILRHENFLAFSADKGEDVRIALTSMKRSGYQWANDLEVSVIDSTSTVTLQRTVALGTERVLTYRVQTSGLHVARLSSGWNLCRAEVPGRPWALVAWGQVPVSICGSVARQYFFVPQQCEEFSIALVADVTGEGALLKIYDATGKVVAQEEGDFDSERRVVVEVPKGADGAAWSLTLEDPEQEDLALDDVTFYLGRALPPYLCEDPGWLETFCSGEEYQPDLIDRRIAIEGGGGFGKSETRSFTWKLNEIPADRVIALRVTATDVDYKDEAGVVLNGNERFFLPVTGDAQTQTFTLILDPTLLRVGENVMEITQDPSGGSSAMRVRDAQLLVGTRIKEFRGW